MDNKNKFINIIGIVVAIILTIGVGVAAWFLMVFPVIEKGNQQKRYEATYEPDVMFLEHGYTAKEGEKYYEVDKKNVPFSVQKDKENNDLTVSFAKDASVPETFAAGNWKVVFYTADNQRREYSFETKEDLNASAMEAEIVTVLKERDYRYGDTTMNVKILPYDKDGFLAGWYYASFTYNKNSAEIRLEENELRNIDYERKDVGEDTRIIILQKDPKLVDQTILKAGTEWDIVTQTVSGRQTKTIHISEDITIRELFDTLFGTCS